MVVGVSLFESWGARHRHCSNQTHGSGGVCPDRLTERQCDVERTAVTFVLLRTVRLPRDFFAPCLNHMSASFARAPRPL